MIELVVVEELAMLGPDEELQRRIDNLNKSLEDLVGRYRRNESMLEILAAQKLDRELAI